MKNWSQSISLLFAALTGLCIFDAPVAQAELNACGGIFLSGDAACEYRPKEQCMTECMTVAVEHSCVAQIYNECETECTATASVECESTCTDSCVDNCTTTTTTSNAPTCQELCLADCDSANDAGTCGKSKHKGPCSRCEQHNCAKRCEEKCGDDPQPKKVMTVTECMPTCTTACSASCTAKANTQCQTDCQERTYVQCETSMVEQCNTTCKQKGGAIFCDGQFINASNVNSCSDELETKINIEVDNIQASLKAAGKAASDSADCVGDSVDKACTVASVGADRTPGHTQAWFGALCPLAGLALWRWNRRRTRR